MEMKIIILYNKSKIGNNIGDINTGNNKEDKEENYVY